MELQERQEDYHYNILDTQILKDHVHLLFDLNPRDGIFPIVNKIEGYISHMLRVFN